MTDIDNLILECGIAAIDARFSILEAVKKIKVGYGYGEENPVLPAKNVSSPGALKDKLSGKDQAIYRIKSKDKKYLPGRHPETVTPLPAAQRRAASAAGELMRGRGASLRGVRGASSVAASTPLHARQGDVGHVSTSEEKRAASGDLARGFATHHDPEAMVSRYARANGINVAHAQDYHKAGIEGKDFSGFHEKRKLEGRHLESPHAEALHNSGRIVAHVRKMVDDVNTKGAFRKTASDSTGEVTSPHFGNPVKHAAYMAGWTHQASKFHDADSGEHAELKRESESSLQHLTSMGHPKVKGEFEHSTVQSAHDEGARDAAHHYAANDWEAKHVQQLHAFGARPRDAERLLDHAKALAHPTKFRDSVDPDTSHRKVDDYTHPESQYTLHLEPQHFEHVHKRLENEARGMGKWSLKFPHADGAVDHGKLHHTELHLDHPLGKVVFKLKPNMEWGVHHARAAEHVEVARDTSGKVSGMHAVEKDRAGSTTGVGSTAKTWVGSKAVLPKINQLWRVKTADAWHERQLSKDKYAHAGQAITDKGTGEALFRHKSGKGTTSKADDAMMAPVLRAKGAPVTKAEAKKTHPGIQKMTPELVHSLGLRPESSRKPVWVADPKKPGIVHVHDVVDSPVTARKTLSVERSSGLSPVRRLPIRKAGEDDKFVPRKVADA